MPARGLRDTQTVIWVGVSGGARARCRRARRSPRAGDAAGSGKSVCNGPCATNWPPLAAGAGAAGSGDWTVVTRDDGARQWAYKGKPLYTFARDTAGQAASGVGPAWPLAVK